MNETQLFALLNELWRDVRQPDFLWQAAALVFSLAFAWWLSWRLLQRQGAPSTGKRSALQAFGAGGLKRVAFPVLALLLVLLFRPLLKYWGRASLLDIAVPLLLTMVLVRAVVYVLRRVFAPSGWLATSERLIAVMVWLCLAIYIVGLTEPLIAMLEQVDFKVGKHKFDLWMALRGAMTILVTVLAALWAADLVEGRLTAAEQMDSTLRVVLARVTKAVLAVLALFFSLSLVGIDVTTLSVFGGALAVGLGFGLQKIASNYVSGFIILLDRSIRIGNLISVDGGATSGTVTQITARYTVVRTLAGTEVIIPNEYLVSNIVQNQSYTDTRVRVAVALQVAYSTDLEAAIRLMQAAAEAHTRVLREPAPAVLLKSFGDNGINLELGFWVIDPEMGIGNVCSEVSLAIWRAFSANGITIPYPQREVRIIAEAAPDSVAESGADKKNPTP